MDTTNLIEELLTRIGALENALGIAGAPRELAPADDVRLSKSGTAKRYNTSTKTIERWRGDPDLDFPQPTIINGRWYFWLSELQAFDRLRARTPYRPQPQRPPPPPPRRANRARKDL